MAPDFRHQRDFTLAGKTAFVTGASSGIGEATAEALAAAGAKVALAARRSDRLEILAARIAGSGGSAAPITCDVTNEQQVRAAVAEATDRLGPIDILVNNAGIMLLGPVCGADTGEWRRMVDLNLMGALYATHAALGGMVERNAGHIVNVTSQSGRVTMPNFAVYCATKFALAAFSDSLRQELVGTGVRITVIEPGVVATELGSHVTHKPTLAWLAKAAAGIEPLAPVDVAEAILFAVTRPPHVGVNELFVRPVTQQP